PPGHDVHSVMERHNAAIDEAIDRFHDYQSRWSAQNGPNDSTTVVTRCQVHESITLAIPGTPIESSPDQSSGPARLIFGALAVQRAFGPYLERRIKPPVRSCNSQTGRRPQPS